MTNKLDVKQFVQDWINGHEPDTFEKNKYGNYIYSTGSASINLVSFFEDLLEDYIEHQEQKIIEIIELGEPQSLIQRANSPTSELINTQLLIEELNKQIK